MWERWAFLLPRRSWQCQQCLAAARRGLLRAAFPADQLLPNPLELTATSAHRLLVVAAESVPQKGTLPPRPSLHGVMRRFPHGSAEAVG